MHEITDGARREHLRWLLELTGVPTATGREHGVVAWVERWCAARAGVTLSSDAAGNLLLWKGEPGEPGSGPVLFTAHMDHPAFVVEAVLRDDEALGETVGEAALRLSFRGGVLDPYFKDGRITVWARDGRRLRATLVDSGPQSPTTGFRDCVADLDGRIDAGAVAPGDIATWDLPGPEVIEGLAHAPACDDLAGVAAALAALDVLLGVETPAPVGVLLTRAEEIGFVGAIAACKQGTIPPDARVLALETSRSYAESPIGGGPIVRVGDRSWTFSPALTGAVAKVCESMETARKGGARPFRWQRRLMPGGTCEATCYGAYGLNATCLCLPLGNYHNMGSLDAVQAGDASIAKAAREVVSVADFEGLVDALAGCGTGLADAEPLSARMERLYAERSFVLRE